MNLSEPIRTALLNATTIGQLLPAYKGSRPIFTRRPAPDDAPYPLIMVSGDVTVTDEDGINDDRPVIMRDVSVYGSNETADQYRFVEDMSYQVRELFHRNRNAIVVPGWSVTDIQCRGPLAAPSDDADHIGRLVALTVRLARS